MQFALLVPIILAVSAVFFVTIERPCMDPTWFRRAVARFSTFRFRRQQ